MSTGVITNELVNGAFSLLNGALEFLNTGIGKTITQIILFSTAIASLIALLKAMKLLSATPLMGAFIGSLGTALPVVVGVTTAVIALSKAFELFKKYQYSKSFEGINEAIAGTDDEIASKQADLDNYRSRIDSLTDAEKEYVNTLEHEIDVLKQKRSAQEQTLPDAAVRDVQKEIIGHTQVGQYKEYNKATDAYNELIEAYKKSEGVTGKQKAALQDYIAQYEPYVNKLKEAGFSTEEIDSKFDGLATKLEVVKGEYKRVTSAVNEASGALANQKEPVENINQALASASEALEKFNNATSIDYGSAFKGYQDVFNKLSDNLGKTDAYTIKAAMDLYLPPEKVKEIGGDLQKGAKELAELFNGQFGKILGAENPLDAFVGMIKSSGGAIKTASGEIAAQIDADGKIQVTSYELLAQALGTAEDVAKAFFGYLQSQSGTIIHTDEQVNELKDALKGIDEQAELSGQNPLEAMVKGISETLNTVDAAEIKSWVDAIFALDGLKPPDNLQEIIDKVNEMNSAAASTDGEEKTMDFTVVVDTTAVDEAQEVIDKLDAKEIAEKLVPVEYGQATAAYDTWMALVNSTDKVHKTEYVDIYETTHKNTEKEATGTKSAKGGATLVNDGTPINGSQAEIIVQDGQAFIANGGETGVVDLKRGATVYNAAETQAILRKKGLQEEDLYGNGIASFADGTAGNKPDLATLDGGYYTDYSEGINYSSALFSFMGYSSADIAKKRKSISKWDDKKRQKELDKIYKELKHYRAMDIINDEEYYRTLYNINETYLKDRKNLEEDYWKYQEEVYGYEADALNDIIEKQEKLNELAKVKTQKVLVYRNGMYQYIQNTEAIAKAQRDVYGYAGGTTSASGGLSLVGENGPELRVLGQGDGIIPADITKNLMRMGSMPLGTFGGSSGDMYNFNIGTVKLENVNDVEGLFNGLKNLAIQKTATKA